MENWRWVPNPFIESPNIMIPKQDKEESLLEIKKNKTWMN